MKSRNAVKKNFLCLGILFFSIICFSYAENDSKKSPACIEHEHKGSEMYFHGRRVLNDTSEFYVTRIFILAKDNKFLSIDVSFNMPIDPEAFDFHKIQINKSIVPQNAAIKFNRGGDGFSISFEKSNIDNDVFSIALPEIKSFNQKNLVNNHFENILANVEFLYENYTENN